MTNPNLENAVFCPVCGLVLFWKCDALGNTIVPEQYFPGGICTYCGHEIIDAPEPWSTFYIKREKFEDEHFENTKYILEHFVIPNPEYNRDAHIRRLEMMQERETSNGFVNMTVYREQTEILGLDVEMPTPKVSRPSSFKPSGPSCPRCGSTFISTQQKFSTGKAVAGGLLAGIAGAIIGGKGSNEVMNVCQNCGHKWKPGNR